MDRLPTSFIPTNRDVICGRASMHHGGNDWCRYLIAAELRKYHTLGLSRKDKTELVTSVVAQVRAQRGPQGGGFVKRNPRSGRWHQITDCQSRRKVLEMVQEIVGSKPQAQQIMPPVVNDDALNKSFLDEYVSKQQAPATEQHNDNIVRTPSAIIKAAATNMTKKRTRNDPFDGSYYEEGAQLVAWPRPHQRRLREPSEERSTMEIRYFQSFLGNLAASIPDSLVNLGNPFEPDPLPLPTRNRGPSSSAYYGS